MSAAGNLREQYDYIIAGTGLAGCSLLVRMMQEPFFRSKKILAIDQSGKTGNDHTWCFWEKQPGIFEPVVYHQWNNARFASEKWDRLFSLAPYEYKMIRASDLYAFVKNLAAQHDNIDWHFEKIVSVENKCDSVTVHLQAVSVRAQYVFSSIRFEEFSVPDGKYFFWQHFRGWMIRSFQPSFDATVATLMDFSISQQNGAGFMYVLPVSAREALVEYTLFSTQPLSTEAYENELRKYISSKLNIHFYEIMHREHGMIPMTNMDFALQEGNVINIGMAGGQVKPSSGYAFQFIQKRTAGIVSSLAAGGKPFMQRSLREKKFRWYDSVMLNVMHHQAMPVPRIFERLFCANKPGRLLKFLDEETSLLQDISIMRSLPAQTFLQAAWRNL